MLAIPHYIVPIVTWLAAIVAIVVAWFAILFTGRYPRALFDFVVGLGRWTLRVGAYAFLLVEPGGVRDYVARYGLTNTIGMDVTGAITHVPSLRHSYPLFHRSRRDHPRPRLWSAGQGRDRTAPGRDPQTVARSHVPHLTSLPRSRSQGFF